MNLRYRLSANRTLREHYKSPLTKDDLYNLVKNY